MYRRASRASASGAVPGGAFPVHEARSDGADARVHDACRNRAARIVVGVERLQFRPSFPQETDMRVMVIVKASKDSEAGVMPSEQLLADMGNFNEELAKAGVMLAAEGLHPSSKGARVRFAGSQRTVTDGPFAETKELIAGFWIWKVASMQEAIDWVKRCPNPMEGESEIEIRPIFEAEDFGEALTPELREQEERLRAQMAEHGTRR
jgi:hypothetical protein